MAQVDTTAPLIAHGFFPDVLYRAFARKDCMEDFLGGNIRFGSLARYRELEDDIRQDNLEGISHVSHGGLDHHGVMPGTSIYVLCCSFSFEATALFGPHIVQIGNPRALADELTSELRLRSETFYEGVEGVMVKYSKGRQAAAMPTPHELIRLSYSQKHDRFQSEQEFRFVAIRKTIGIATPETHLTLAIGINLARAAAAPVPPQRGTTSNIDDR